MPLISEFKNNKKTVFQKKSYRPWDNNLSEDIEKDNSIKESTKPLFTDLDNLVDNNIINSEQQIFIGNDENTKTPLNHIELDLKKELRNLFGAQRIIMQYLLKNTEDNTQEYMITKNISMKEFTLSCKLPPNTIKTTLQKLKAKSLLTTYENKRGRGGYGRYQFTKLVYNFFSKNLF